MHPPGLPSTRHLLSGGSTIRRSSRAAMNCGTPLGDDPSTAMLDELHAFGHAGAARSERSMASPTTSTCCCGCEAFGLGEQPQDRLVPPAPPRPWQGAAAAFPPFGDPERDAPLVVLRACIENQAGAGKGPLACFTMPQAHVPAGRTARQLGWVIACGVDSCNHSGRRDEPSQ